MSTIPQHSIHLPGLSIIRVIAAFSVLFGHFYQFGRWGDVPHIWLPEIYTPVTTFFVISGFLIAWGLLREVDRTGDVDITNAYKRRAIRILPLYYIGVLLGFAALWTWGDSIEGNVPLLLCLMPNLAHALGEGVFPLWHYWTLGTEVMFYLWFPWIIVWCRKYLLQVLCAIGIGWMLLKWGCYVVLGKGFVYRFVCVTQFDTIMMGAVAAMLFYEDRAWLRRICSNWGFTLISWCLFLSTNLWMEFLPSPVRAEMIAMLSVMVILSGFYGHPVLENKVTQYVGNLTYGIYLFHPIVIYFCSHWTTLCNTMCEYNKGGYAVAFAIICLTVGLSAMLHHLVEKSLAKKLRK